MRHSLAHRLRWEALRWAVAFLLLPAIGARGTVHREVAAWAGLEGATEPGLSVASVAAVLKEANTSATENLLLLPSSAGGYVCYVSGVAPVLSADNGTLKGVAGQDVTKSCLFDVLLGADEAQVLRGARQVKCVDLKVYRTALVNYCAELGTYVEWVAAKAPALSSFVNIIKSELKRVEGGIPSTTAILRKTTLDGVLTALQQLEKGRDKARIGLTYFVHTEAMLMYDVLVKKKKISALPQAAPFVFLTHRDMCAVCEDLMVRLLSEIRGPTHVCAISPIPSACHF